jgi:hypothetical protein
MFQDVPKDTITYKILGTNDGTYYIITVCLALVQYFISFKQNYQNYQNLSYLIIIGLIYTFFMVGVISYIAIHQNWLAEPAFKIKNASISNDIENFPAPPFCVMPSLTITFCFQYYLLQIVSTMKADNKPSNHRSLSGLNVTQDVSAARNMGFATVFIIGVIYAFTIGVSWVASPNENEITMISNA